MLYGYTSAFAQVVSISSTMLEIYKSKTSSHWHIRQSCVHEKFEPENAETTADIFKRTIKIMVTTKDNKLISKLIFPNKLAN